MANRPNIKAWSASTNEELLARHGELVAKLQDPAYAGVDPSTVKSGSPMHVLDRGTLNSLEAELDKRGATYTPSRGTIIPMPGTTPASAIPTSTSAAPPAAPQPAATVTPRRQIPIGQPAQNTAPTSAPTAAPTTTTKPLGRPVTSVTASAPPPTGAGTQQVSGQMTAAVQDTTNFSKNTTPGKIAAVVEQNAPPKSLTSGAPTPRPFLKKTGDDISKALLGGTKGTRNIKLAGAAALLGLGAYTVNKKSHQTNDDYDRKLEMQRRGMMM